MSTKDRILSLCEKNNIKVATLEKAVGLANGTIQKWTDKSTPRGDSIAKIAVFFGVTTDYLLCVDDRHTVTDDDIKFALFGGDGEITDEQYDEVKRFAQFVKERNGNH